ncbi:MAG TPA: hypothetical protein VLM42_13060 [Bryobacteraceae bacterium]|nr:hypothetical protein [Bryobacteraceae bacterium]
MIRRTLAVLLLASAALAQQEARQSWRKTDPDLERDAATAGATLGARADKAAAEAAKYFAAQKTSLESLAMDTAQKASAVAPLTLTPETSPDLDAYLARQNMVLSSSIDTIARDPDRGIQQLRQALERERAAGAVLSAASKDARKAREAVAQTASSAEQARLRTVELYQKLASSLQRSAQLTEQSGTAWAGYYRSLSDAARRAAVPVTSSVPQPNSPPAVVPPAAVARNVPPVPLSRYVGAWTYPTVGAHFHGAQPLSAELVVREENGRAGGTLSARFKLPPGNTGDPVVQFNFEGTIQSTRDQTFAVTTSSGAKGTLELIPGPAFNLLEVNFSTDEKPGTIRQGNFLLVKK